MTRSKRLAPGQELSGTNLERAGDYNQRIMLQAIRIHGPATRPDLAAFTGLTLPSVANITKRLIDDGLVHDAGQKRGGRGSPATRLAVSPDGCFALGVNIDRDHVTTALVNFAGEIKEQVTAQIEFPRPKDVTRLYELAVSKLLLGRDGVTDKLVGVGVAMPDDFGAVDLPHRPADFSLWSRTDVKSLFTGGPPLPVYTENDAAAAALAELQFGIGASNPSFFYILVSWGLGGTLVVEGECFRGADGRSGEIGFLPLNSKGGSLQDLVSLSALHARLETAEGGDASPRAAEIKATWIEDASEALIGTVLSICCIVNPQAIFVGGRLEEPVLEAFVAALNAKLARQTGLPTIAPVLVAKGAEAAPVIGAAILPFRDRLLPSRASLRKKGGAVRP